MSKIYTVVRMSAMMMGIGGVQSVLDHELERIANFLPGNTKLVKTTQLAASDLSIPFIVEMENDFFLEPVSLEFQYHRYVIPDGITAGKRLHQDHAIIGVKVMPVQESIGATNNSATIESSLK